MTPSDGVTDVGDGWWIDHRSVPGRFVRSDDLARAVLDAALASGEIVTSAEHDDLLAANRALADQPWCAMYHEANTERLELRRLVDNLTEALRGVLTEPNWSELRRGPVGKWNDAAEKYDRTLLNARLSLAAVERYRKGERV